MINSAKARALNWCPLTIDRLITDRQAAGLGQEFRG